MKLTSKIKDNPDFTDEENNFFELKFLRSPENIPFFLGTTITFQKLPTFLARNFTLYGLFHQKLVVPIISEVAFSTLLYSIFGKIKQNIAFQ